MRNYSCLKKNIFKVNEFSLVPIREQDKFTIMKMRNEQTYHLRQNKQLTIEEQNNYFSNIISKLFQAEQPNQILFSFLKDNECVGYGGLVHINWIDKNAEISFIMKTKLEEKKFHFYWTIYLSLIEMVAFNQLQFCEINTYAYDLRPKLYCALEDSGYIKKNQSNSNLILDNKPIKIIVHSKKNINENN